MRSNQKCAVLARRKTVNKIDILNDGAEVVFRLEGVEARLHPAEAGLIAALVSNAAMRAAAILEGRVAPAVEPIETPGAIDAE
jgi:hypothetical protein